MNSLEQLIDINQTLTTALGGTPSSSGNGASGQHGGSDSRREFRKPLPAAQQRHTASRQRSNGNADGGQALPRRHGSRQSRVSRLQIRRHSEWRTPWTGELARIRQARLAYDQ